MSATISRFEERSVPVIFVGTAVQAKNEVPTVTIRLKDNVVLEQPLSKIRNAWESTSLALEKLQANPICIDKEADWLKADRMPTISYRWDEELVKNTTLTESNLSPKVAILREEGSNGDREMAAAFKMAGFSVVDVTMTDVMTGCCSLEDFTGIAFVGGFSYADVLGSAKGWAATILANPVARIQFESFYTRPDTFSLGVCNGCQLMALLGWIGDLEDDEGDKENSPPRLEMASPKPLRFTHNTSQRFESRFPTVKINPSPSIMLRGMENWELGVWIAHGEGRLEVIQEDGTAYLQQLVAKSLACLQFVSPEGIAGPESYPQNPNGSPMGITGVVSPNGRHLAIMPHPERCVRWWQWPWVDRSVNAEASSPWLTMFHNAYRWCANREWEAN